MRQFQRTAISLLFFLGSAWLVSAASMQPAPLGEADNPDTSLSRAGCAPVFSWKPHSGIGWSVSYDGEAMTDASEGEGVLTGLLQASLDVDAGKLAGWSGVKVHVCGLLPQGGSLTNEDVGDLFAVSNIDAPNTARLFECWIEKTFAGGAASIRIGQMSADEEFAGTDYGGLFINGTFGWPPTISLNTPAPAYPSGALGARLAVQGSHGRSLLLAVFSGNADPTDAAGRSLNPHGTRFAWTDGSLIMGEMTQNWGGSGRLPGFLKAGLWYHTAKTADLRYDTQGRSLADAASNGRPEEHRGDEGLYLAYQQQIWSEGPGTAERQQGLGVFSRFGVCPPDQNLMPFYVEAGVHYLGLLPSRDKDECGIGMAFGRISNRLRGLTRDENFFSGLNQLIPDYEAVIEASYRCVLNPTVALQPTVQYIMHPGGLPAENTLVLGLRTSIGF